MLGVGQFHTRLARCCDNKPRSILNDSLTKRCLFLSVFFRGEKGRGIQKGRGVFMNDSATIGFQLVGNVQSETDRLE